mmetsp:Transcript_130317/g.416819  ORF Transcript_130317/g.416819 Transcript_130317/m.416819 type:complete len:99 (+) Transcript_130317:449-745(+)
MLRRPQDSVPCLSLAELFVVFHIRRVSLLKVDCEGCEYNMFSSATSGALLQRIDRITGELHVPDEEVSRQQVALASRIFCRHKGAVQGCREPAIPYPL